MTTKDFHEYLINLGLFRLKIWEDETGMNAIVNSMPNLGWFTQFKQVPKSDGRLFEVRLSKKDYYNEQITRGFFNG
jgi:hypothetical protein